MLTWMRIISHGKWVTQPRIKKRVLRFLESVRGLG